MDVPSQLKVTGNPECMVCGFGESCPMSSLSWVFGNDPKVIPEKFCQVEDPAETGEHAKALGKEITRKLGQRMRGKPGIWKVNIPPAWASKKPIPPSIQMPIPLFNPGSLYLSGM